MIHPRSRSSAFPFFIDLVNLSAWFYTYSFSLLDLQLRILKAQQREKRHSWIIREIKKNKFTIIIYSIYKYIYIKVLISYTLFSYLFFSSISSILTSNSSALKFWNYEDKDFIDLYIDNCLYRVQVVLKYFSMQNHH